MQVRPPHHWQAPGLQRALRFCPAAAQQQARQARLVRQRPHPAIPHLPAARAQRTRRRHHLRHLRHTWHPKMMLPQYHRCPPRPRPSSAAQLRAESGCLAAARSRMHPRRRRPHTAPRRGRLHQQLHLCHHRCSLPAAVHHVPLRGPARCAMRPARALRRPPAQAASAPAVRPLQRLAQATLRRTATGADTAYHMPERQLQRQPHARRRAAAAATAAPRPSARRGRPRRRPRASAARGATPRRRASPQAA